MRRGVEKRSGKHAIVISFNLQERSDGVMKRFTYVSVSLSIIALLVNSAASQNRSQAGFEKLKSLAGDWQGKGDDGQPFYVSYKIVSNGSALVETLSPASESAMITLYHLDGDSLIATHYCSIGNQPRMRAQSPTGEVGSLNFTFIDATNLAKPTDSHMRSLTLTFKDKDHLVQTWTFRNNGKDESMTLDLERKKSA
jgi:hypothetical protein